MMHNDKTYQQLIHSYAWQSLRKEKLTQCPLCERCQANGRVTAATEVHHRTPVESIQTLAEQKRLIFQFSNLQSLCHECHLQTHRELGKNTKAESKRRNAALVEETKNKFFN